MWDADEIVDAAMAAERLRITRRQFQRRFGHVALDLGGRTKRWRWGSVWDELLALEHRARRVQHPSLEMLGEDAIACPGAYARDVSDLTLPLRHAAPLLGAHSNNGGAT